jgi:hypothetical protein
MHDYRGLKEFTRKDTYPLPRADNTIDKLKDANYTHLDLASGFGKLECAMRTSTRPRF